MSLLHDVLRSHTPDSLDPKHIGRHRRAPSYSIERDDSDDDLVNVVSFPGSPSGSQTHSRAPSPTRGASTRPIPGPLRLRESRPLEKDPLKALPTELSQRVFSCLSVPELATCALVSRKWNRSQTINYVWFQHYRKENFYDNCLPPGKWTKRESKQNWRALYLQPSRSRSPHSGSLHRGSGYSSPPASGRQTPKELNEEKWRLEAEATQRPNKVEMRGIYKELGGRKAKTKTKLGSTGSRDKGGWGDDYE